MRTASPLSLHFLTPKQFLSILFVFLVFTPSHPEVDCKSNPGQIEKSAPLTPNAQRQQLEKKPTRIGEHGCWERGEPPKRLVLASLRQFPGPAYASETQPH